MSDFERLRKLRDSAAIAGIGETPFSRNSGKTSEELYVRVALDAISDAGLVPGDIDGLMMPSYTALPPGLLETFLNITPNYTGLVDVGGASAGSLVLNAALLVSSGVATNVLCITARNDSSGRGGRRRSGANARQTVSGYSSLTVPYGWTNPPSMYAMMARRHMHKYGGPTTTQLGWVAVTMRKHASLNEHAQMRTPISLEKHAASRMIAEPFRLLDCCLISDGGAAVVVTTAERARDCPKPPVLLSGFAQGRPSSPADLVNRPAMEELGLERAAPTALTMAGITVSEIDFAEIYDCFTYVVIKQLEILGFCKAGEGGSFVENGRIGLDGELPVNTHGGLLSQGHMSGMNHIVEAVRQLRREAGPSQVPKARTGLVTGYGDLGDASVLVLRSAA